MKENSMAVMYEREVLKKRLAENKARQLNEEMFVFLKDHPSLHAFDMIKALEDLKKVTELNRKAE